ncbi:unnamed protein product [Calypogeia fissa]
MAEAGRPKYSISKKTHPIKLWTFLSALSLLAAVAGGFNEPWIEIDGALDPNFGYAEKFITPENSQFGPKIEGTSVDSLGRVYAVDFQDQTRQLGQLSNERGEVDQKLFFKWGDKKSYFNGIRFFPVPRDDSNVFATAFLADKKGQVIQVIQSKKDGVVRGRVFCKDKHMIEPNDVAVSYTTMKVYSTGLNYAPNTTYGDGDIWICDIPKDSAIHSADLGEGGSVAKATRLKLQGRANGIEVSSDEKHLYATETWATDMKIHSNVVWKYDIDQETGLLSNKRLFFDMKEIDEELQGTAGDIDGVRTDMAGNLFLVRNGEPGEVVKVSPEGKLVTRIKLPGIIEPTNIELGGPHGTTLFIVGKCRENQKLGCIDKWENYDSPGRAFFHLYRPGVPPPSNEVETEEHDEL